MNSGTGQIIICPYGHRKPLDAPIPISYPVPMNKSRETNHEHHRRSIRLRGYDYSENGAYFVTICTHNREHLFGKIENGRMRLNDVGNMAKKCWLEIPKHYPFVTLDIFVVMPNHIHGIIVIERPIVVGANNHSPDPVPECVSAIGNGTNGNKNRTDEFGFRANGNENRVDEFGFRANDYSPLRKPGTSGTIGAVVRGFKIGVTKWCRAHARANVVWQRNYYERIIRDDGEWNAFREYIEKNPEMWNGDELNSRRIAID